MLTHKPLAEAKVLVVGVTAVVQELLKGFSSQGVKHLGVLNASDEWQSPYEHIKKDPEESIKADPEFFRSFDIVLAIDQPRDFEVAVSDLFWPKEGGPRELPMMVSRSLANNCKMRSQYQELKLNDGTTARFVSLHEDLWPWTDEKRAIVSSTARSAFPSGDSTSEAYLAASKAFVGAKTEPRGPLPGPGDLDKIKSSIKYPSGVDKSVVDGYLEKLCNDGLGSVAESRVLLARLIVSDAVKLLTGDSQPINNTSLGDAIELA